MKDPRLAGRLQRMMAGVDAGVEVFVEHPAPEPTVVTVIDVQMD